MIDQPKIPDSGKCPPLENQKFLGYVKLTLLYPNDEKQTVQKYDPDFKKFMHIEENKAFAQEIVRNAGYREVRANLNNIKSAIKKADVKMTYPDLEINLGARTAEHYADIYLTPILHTNVKVDGHEYNGQSGGGVIAKSSGYPKTCEYMKSDVFEEFSPRIDFIPMNQFNNKREYLSTEDNQRKKVRLTENNGKETIRKAKLLYGNQNDNMALCWRKGYIKYGMVKQYGGFSDYVIDFEDCTLISSSDVTGWDKNCFLGRVYYLRNLHLVKTGWNDYMYKLMNYTTYYTKYPVKIMFDGSVYWFCTSNSSGQNNTPSDNCIAHIIMSFHIVLEVYFDTYGEYPEYSTFITCFKLGVYSDDKNLGLRGPLSNVNRDTFLRIEREVYAQYGMIIKETQSFCFEHKPGTRFVGEKTISFLGSTAYWDGYTYIPIPRIEKLCTSLVFNLVDKEPLAPPEQFFKIISILSLVPPDLPEFNKLAEAIFRFSRYIYDSYPEDNAKFAEYRDSLMFNKNDCLPGCTNYTTKKFVDFNYLFTGEESARNTVLFFISDIAAGWEGFIINIMNQAEMEALAGLNSKMPINDGGDGSTKAFVAEKKLLNNGMRVGATYDGMCCLSNLLDTCKDSEVDPTGWPDKINSRNIVQKVQATTTFSKPSSLGAGNWDCEIYMSPLISNVRMNQFDKDLFPQFADTATITPSLHVDMGGLEMRAALSGTKLTPSTIVQNIPLDPKYKENCNVRVIGMGFEVANTTGQLYKQGSVTVFRTVGSSLDETMMMIVSNSGSVAGSHSSWNCFSLPRVPEDQNEAKRIPNSRTWKAEDGCYVNYTLASDDLTAYAGNELVNQPYYFENNTNPTPKFWLTEPSVAGDGTILPNPGPDKYPLFAPFNQSGAFFGGLSEQTALTINYVWIIERFPNIVNTDLIVLSRKATLDDPVARELYSRVADALPPGVEFSENDFGDWINTIADIAGAAGVPFTGLVKTGVNAARFLMSSKPIKTKNGKINSQAVQRNFEKFNSNQQRELQNINRKVKQLENKSNQKKKVVVKRANAPRARVRKGKNAQPVEYIIA